MHKFSRIVKNILITVSMLGTAHAGHWKGFYVGVNAGFAFNNIQLNSQHLGFTDPSETCNDNSDYSTFFPGIQLGYLYQLPNAFVSGIEANVTVNTNQNHRTSCNSMFNPGVYDGFTFKNRMQSSIRGRIGRAITWHQKMFLPYLTLGGSIANVGLTYKNEGGDYYSKNTTHAGWLIGAGLEWMFWQHWSVRAEYYYLNYGNTINLKIPNIYGLIDANGNARASLSSNNIAVAINYWV